MFRLVFMLGLLLCAIGVAKDELRFDQKEKTVNVTANQDIVSVSFPFRNASDKQVKLGRLELTCDCTTAAYSKGKKQLGAGEECSVEVEVSTGAFVGTDSKSVIVHAAGSKYTLTVTAVIPETVRMQPRKLEWKKGEALQQKTLTISVDPKSGIELKSVSLKGKDFEYEPVTIKKGREYRVLVTPKSTDSRKTNTLWIETDAILPRDARLMSVLTVSTK